MNKKKLGTGLLALALVGVVGIGGSLAWFTDTDNRTNTFTTGKVDITLTEYDENGEEAPEGIVYEDVMPGNVETKEIVVTNDESEAWVRVKVTINGLPAENAKELIFIDSDDAPIQIHDNDYVVEDEDTVTFYFPQQHMLANNGSGKYVPFTKVMIPETWGNDLVKKTFTIDVVAQALQYENNEYSGFAGVDESLIVSVD